MLVMGFNDCLLQSGPRSGESELQDVLDLGTNLLGHLHTTVFNELQAHPQFRGLLIADEVIESNAVGKGESATEFQDVLHLLNDGGFHLHATVLNELEALLKVGLLLPDELVEGKGVGDGESACRNGLGGGHRVFPSFRWTNDSTTISAQRVSYATC